MRFKPEQPPFGFEAVLFPSLRAMDVRFRPPTLHLLEVRSPVSPTETPIGPNGETCIPVGGTYMTQSMRAPSRLSLDDPALAPQSPDAEQPLRPAGFDGFGWAPDLSKLRQITSPTPGEERS